MISFFRAVPRGRIIYFYNKVVPGDTEEVGGALSKKKKKHSPGIKTDDNGNAMFKSYLSKLFKKGTGCRYARTAAMGNTGKKKFVFLGLFVHAAVSGGTCAFTLKIVNTLIKNSSRDGTPSIST